MKKLKGIGQLATVAFVLVLVGCFVPSTGSVTVSIDPIIDCNRISSIKVEVYSGSTNRYLAGDSFDCSVGQVMLEDIPVGSNRRVVVSAIAIDDTLRYQGEMGNITISRNEITDIGVVTLSRVGTNEVPVVTIIQPQDGETIPFGKEIIFEGSGEDPEDGQLTGSSLQWESDLDGPIGEGTQFTVNDLSPGEHTITLTATDYEGGVGTATTQISISSELENSIGMVFKLIPAGTFIMGSPGSYSPEERQHKVALTRSYYIQTTEVTQGQWRALMGDNPSSFKQCGENCPVEWITWYDSVIFCNRLSQLEGLMPSYYADSSYTTVFTGTPPVTSDSDIYWNQDANGYRLPTEAEWEYAARAGSTTAFANGDITLYEDMSICNYDSNLDAMGWYCYNTGMFGTPGYGTKLVAQKDANAWGLFDMHGNVKEWCQDWYDYYPLGEVTFTDPTGPSFGSDRVVRGGNSINFARSCRADARRRNEPGYRDGFLGVRLALPTGQ